MFPISHGVMPGISRRFPGKPSNIEFVIKDIAEICGLYNVQKIAFDRWNKKTFDKELLRLGVTLPEVVEFGQGFQSMSPAIKVLRPSSPKARCGMMATPASDLNALERRRHRGRGGQ